MENLELTPWHPVGTRPVHVGVYEIKPYGTEGRVFAHWNGVSWGCFAWVEIWGSVSGAIHTAERYSTEEYRVEPNYVIWRGLAVQP